MYQTVASALRLVLGNVEKTISESVKKAGNYLLELNRQVPVQFYVDTDGIPTGYYRTVTGYHHALKVIRITNEGVWLRFELEADFLPIEQIETLTSLNKISILEVIETEILNLQNESK